MHTELSIKMDAFASLERRVTEREAELKAAAVALAEEQREARELAERARTMEADAQRMMMSLEVERARMESTRESQAALQGQLVAKEAASEQTNGAIAKWEQAAKEASERWEQRQYSRRQRDRSCLPAQPGHR